MLPEMQRTAQSSPVPVPVPEPAFSELHQLVLAERIIGSQLSPARCAFWWLARLGPPWLAGWSMATRHLASHRWGLATRSPKTQTHQPFPQIIFPTHHPIPQSTKHISRRLSFLSCFVPIFSYNPRTANSISHQKKPSVSHSDTSDL